MFYKYKNKCFNLLFLIAIVEVANVFVLADVGSILGT
jgi:hypothetical protein